MSLKKCVKLFFYILNAILFLLGMASLGVGIWMAVAPESFLDLTSLSGFDSGNSGLVRVSGYIMISAGGATALFSILGIIGAAKESACLLGMYITLLVLALALQITAVVLGVVFRDNLEKNLEEKMIDSLKMEYKGPKINHAVTSAWNTLMSKYECCGVKNASQDFAGAKQWTNRVDNGTYQIVPSTCCKIGYDNCGGMPYKNNSYTDGCLDTLKDLLYEYHSVLIGVSAGVVGFQFILVVLAVCVFSQINKPYSLGNKD